ncbi:hypothetical protein [Polycladidibacter hongkongensis]|uniref:hypothetical protein n=1 Tax=Polycladidibacter hongkongensis TaxID=1647556 RepID=UPI0008341F98|nr:hypothetical protein [Pseudovibrio hongkongensis]
MKRLIVSAALALMLVACQTVSNVSSQNPPQVYVSKPVATTKADAIRLFQNRGFRLRSSTSSKAVLRMPLETNSAERKTHASYSTGLPQAEITLRFSKVDGGTLVTGGFDMLVSPDTAKQERVTLLDSPDGGRLQRALNELK